MPAISRATGQGLSPSMSATTTASAPSLANFRASARPMPRAPPVTTTTRLVTSTQHSLVRVYPARRLGRCGPEGTATVTEFFCEIAKTDGFRDERYRIESLPMVGGGLDYSAPFQRAIELIGKRWTGAVVKALLPGPARFNQLLAGIPGISDRVLTERLRELETEAIVERLAAPAPPVRGSSRLTSRGRALQPVLAAACLSAVVCRT